MWLESPRPRKYWNALKTKLQNEGHIELSQFMGQLKMPSPDGKMRETDAANTEGMFRIIQSIPSPTDIELIFTMLGEATTRNKAVEKDAQGFNENRVAAQEGGKAAGKALEGYETEAGEKVVTGQNFKQQIKEAKKKQKELKKGEEEL